tara:strand:+ start:3538 stop:3792 length:255 start_codon:yes stop_codon:yes gene_type:complete
MMNEILLSILGVDHISFCRLINACYLGTFLQLFNYLIDRTLIVFTHTYTLSQESKKHKKKDHLFYFISYCWSTTYSMAARAFVP